MVLGVFQRDRRLDGVLCRRPGRSSAQQIQNCQTNRQRTCCPGECGHVGREQPLVPETPAHQWPRPRAVLSALCRLSVPCRPLGAQAASCGLHTGKEAVSGKPLRNDSITEVMCGGMLQRAGGRGNRLTLVVSVKFALLGDALPKLQHPNVPAGRFLGAAPGLSLERSRNLS